MCVFVCLCVFYDLHFIVLFVSVVNCLIEHKDIVDSVAAGVTVDVSPAEISSLKLLETFFLKSVSVEHIVESADK